jgi:hypothetical protein
MKTHDEMSRTRGLWVNQNTVEGETEIWIDGSFEVSFGLFETDDVSFLTSILRSTHGIGVRDGRKQVGAELKKLLDL